MIGEAPGGRSTHGICYGVLCWRVDRGNYEDLDLSGLAAALAVRYDDDEPGSPWSIVLHVDERGTDEQRRALERILLGGAEGDVKRLPWIRKPRNLIDVRVSSIELVGTHLRVGTAVEIDATQPFATAERVACGIPGYERAGTEYTTDLFVVDDAPFSWELTGNCAFAADFEYSS